MELHCADPLREVENITSCSSSVIPLISSEERENLYLKSSLINTSTFGRQKKKKTLHTPTTVFFSSTQWGYCCEWRVLLSWLLASSDQRNAFCTLRVRPKLGKIFISRAPDSSSTSSPYRFSLGSTVPTTWHYFLEAQSARRRR